MIHTEWLSAKNTTPRFKVSDVEPSTRYLILTQDDQVIIDGTAAEIRELLTKALATIPEEDA